MTEWKQRQPKIRYHPNDSIIEKLLKIRGIENSGEFLNPGKDVLIDPCHLHNIDVVAERIVRAIKQRELISISADVDV